MPKKRNKLSNKDIEFLLKDIETVAQSASDFHVEFVDYIQTQTTVAQRVNMKELIKLWNRTLGMVTTLKETSEDVTTNTKHVSPVTVDLPFTSDTFVKAWQEWKDYLTEQYSVILSSRAEQRQLYFLKLYSHDNEDRAASIIFYSISKLYRTFFNYTDTELKGKVKSKHIDDGEY